MLMKLYTAPPGSRCTQANADEDPFVKVEASLS
jgi:hypothetical protein